MRPITPELTEQERRVLADIAEHGCHIISVPGDDEGPEYSFSVGFWHTWDHPEIVVVGLDEEVGPDLINAVADMIDDGMRCVDGQVTEGLVHAYPVTFKSVPTTHLPGYLGTACWAHDSRAFPVLQLVYPDKQGRYPWHRGVATGFKVVQPLLADLPPRS